MRFNCKRPKIWLAKNNDKSEKKNKNKTIARWILPICMYRNLLMFQLLKLKKNYKDNHGEVHKCLSSWQYRVLYLDQKNIA